MKICAITMVYKDYWALSQWYAHYSKYLGPEHLFIISHGFDDKFSELCPCANIISIPRDDLSNFDTARGQMLNSFQDGLGIAYDWVIRTDADELVFLDPSLFTSFEDVFSNVGEASSVFALGLNVVEHSDPSRAPVDAIFTGHYSKAWAVKRGTHLIRHGIYTRRRILKKVPMVLPEGVYLAHLKYANVSALASANEVRLAVTTQSDVGMPGTAWSKSTKNAENFFTRFSLLEAMNWEDAKRDAFNEITADPVRDAEHHILRAKSIRFEHRTILPDWFKLHTD